MTKEQWKALERDLLSLQNVTYGFNAEQNTPEIQEARRSMLRSCMRIVSHYACEDLKTAL